MPTANSKYTNKADSLRIGDWNSLFWAKSQKKVHDKCENYTKIRL